MEILLGFVILVVGLLGAGFYFLIDAFENSARVTPGAGALRILLCCLAIGSGGLLAAYLLSTA